MKVSLRAILLSSLLLASMAAFSQNHELAVTAGGDFPHNNSYTTQNSFTFGAQYSGRLVHVPLAALYVDAPLVVAPNSTFNGAGICSNVTCSGKYSAVFFTPGLKLKVAPEFPLSPYVVAGGGFAHYSAGKKPFSNVGDTATKGVFEFGGGVDMKVAPFFSVRGDVRDFYSGSPEFTGTDSKQHNVVTQVGLVLRF